MKRNHTGTDNTTSHGHLELFRQVAFHEAGHAVAIYIRNTQLRHPAYFQISVHSRGHRSKEHNYLAKVNGGRLINNPRLGMMQFSKYLFWRDGNIPPFQSR